MRTFLDCLPVERRFTADLAPAISRALDELIARATEQVPNAVMTETAFLTLAAARVAEAEDLLAAVAELDPGELAVACWCATGGSAAVAEIERRYFRYVDAQLGKLALARDQVLEVKQRLREHMLVGGPGQPPRICDYAGTGRLAGVLGVTAMRIAYKHHRRERRNVAGDTIFDALPDAAADPELALHKQRHREQFKAAFVQAAETLTARQRNLLRMQLIEHVTLDDLARIYRVHRATIARWLKEAREHISQVTRELLAEQWGLDDTEVRQIRELIQSQLDLSVSRVLGEPNPEEP